MAGDVNGLVPAPTNVLRREVRGVGLGQHAVRGDALGGRAQPITPGIGHGAGEGDAESQREPGLELVRALAVAVHHAADLGAPTENRANALARVADVKDDREIEERGYRDLRAKRALLLLDRRAPAG